MVGRHELLGLASDIVSAHVSNNAVAPDQLPSMRWPRSDSQPLRHQSQNQPCPSSSRRERIILCASTAASTSRC